MEKFTVLNGLVAPLDRANVDTDAIIPKQFLKSIKRSGYGRELSVAGAREFTNIQTIWIGPAEASQPTSQPAE